MKRDARILIVDDEENLLALVVPYLQNAGYTTVTAHNGKEALQMLEKSPIDLAILDVMMPGMDGFTLCAEIRRQSAIPIIMLTAKGSEEDRVRGLKIGADDYIVKPFSLNELTARVEAALRRSQTLQSSPRQLQIQELAIDLDGREVKIAGSPVSLTKREYDLLLFLIEHRGQVFTRDQLHDRIWGMDHSQGTLRTVDTHIKTLRLKLQTASKYLKTVWGVGYKFEG